MSLLQLHNGTSPHPGRRPLEPREGGRKCSLLVVDDEPYILPTLTALLAREFDVTTADSADAAKTVFARRPIDIVLSDQRMPRQTGVQLLEWVRQNSPETVRLLMTGYAELDDAVEAINRGQVYHYLMKPWRTEELLQVLHNAAEKYQLERNQEHLLNELRLAKDDLERRVQERTRELEDANRMLEQKTRELERLALTDALTGLLNRRAMDNIAQNELKRHTRYGSPLAVAVVDADHFREINRRYLLPGGDQVLMNLARVLTGSLRNVDTVGRIGGEEFLVIAPETNLEGANVLGERIRSAVEDMTVFYKGQLIRVTVSVGFAVAEGGVATDFEDMKHVASACLAEAKAEGRNRCVVKALVPTSMAGGLGI